MPELIACLSTGKGTWKEVTAVMNQHDWEGIYLITNDFGKEKFTSLKKGTEVIGTRVRVKIVKNKMAPPFRDAIFTITGNGIDREDALIDAAISSGILVKSGSFIKHKEKVLGQGKEQVKDMLAKDEKFKNALIKEVYARVFAG